MKKAKEMIVELINGQSMKFNVCDFSFSDKEYFIIDEDTGMGYHFPASSVLMISYKARDKKNEK